MSTFRRLRRVGGTKLVLFVVVYSAVLCETSSIFDFFKRATSSSGRPGPGPGSAGNSIDDGERDFENSHHFSGARGSVSRSGEINPSQPDPSIEHYEHSAVDSSGHNGQDNYATHAQGQGQGQAQSHSHSHHGDGHHYGQDNNNMMMARGHGGWGGWGYGGQGHGGDSSLDLYSLLGGLSFASLLGATIVYLARRSSSTTTVMMNTSGRRRRRDLDDADEELSGESLPEFLGKLGVHLESPWWKSREEDKKFVVPFKLNM